MQISDRDAQTLIAGMAVIKRDMALLHEKVDLLLEQGQLVLETEKVNSLATQADVDALRARVQADNATEAATLQVLKDDFAALQTEVQNSGANVDLSGLAGDLDQLDQQAAQEQEVGTENQPPAPPQPSA